MNPQRDPRGDTADAGHLGIGPCLIWASVDGQRVFAWRHQGGRQG